MTAPDDRPEFEPPRRRRPNPQPTEQPMTPELVRDRCGTHAGYQAHRRRGEQPCVACRAANAEYSAQRRRDNPAVYNWNKSNEYARSRALRRLARLYPDVMRALYDEELRAMRLRDASRRLPAARWTPPDTCAGGCR